MYYTWEDAQTACPQGWRLPVVSEIEKLLDASKINNDWGSINRVNGRTFTDKSTKNNVFFPAGGFMISEKTPILSGEWGNYWTGIELDSYYAYSFPFDDEVEKWYYGEDEQFGYRFVKYSKSNVRCVKEETEQLPEYYVIENFGDKIDYAILGVDGTGYFLEAYDENPNIPKRLSIYDGNNIELVINFDVEGLPKNIVSEDFTIVLENYVSNKFNAIVITKEGTRELFENIETDIFWDEYKNSLISGGLRVSSSTMATRGLWSDVGKGLVKVTLLGVTTVGCAFSAAFFPTGISAALAVISCGSVAQQFGELTGLYELPSIIPEGVSLLGDALGAGLNCLKAGANVGSLFECLQSITEFVLTMVDNFLSANSGETILNNLKITSPSYGDIYHCGDWIDIFVSGYTGADWQDSLELQYWCLRYGPQPDGANESYTNKALPRKEGTSSNPSFTFSPENPSTWDGNWVKLVATNKKDNTSSAPQYIQIAPRNIYEIVGVWKTTWQRNNTNYKGTVTLTINNNLDGLLEWVDTATGIADRYNVSVNYSNGYNIKGTTWIEESISPWGFLNIYNGVISNGELKGLVRDDFLTNEIFTFVKQ